MQSQTSLARASQQGQRKRSSQRHALQHHNMPQRPSSAAFSPFRAAPFSLLSQSVRPYTVLKSSTRHVVSY